MAGAGKDNIKVIKQELPKFIREFKERTNQPDAPDINSKRLLSKCVDDDDDHNELNKADEVPIICVDKGVTEEEAYKFTKEVFGEEVVSKSDLNLKRKHNKDDNEDEDSGKVLFKKPTKEKFVKKKIKSEMPKVKNNTLLSFGDDDDEEEEGSRNT